jgi:hypothetical protein
MAAVLPWNAQGSPVDNDTPWGPALLIRYHRHQFWPGGLSLLNQCGIDASRQLEAG